MGKGGKSGSGAHDYFASWAGLMAMGPLTHVRGLILDSKLAWPVAVEWADGVDAVPSLTRRRVGGYAYVRWSGRTKLGTGGQFIATGFSDSSFNAPSATTVDDGVDEFEFRYANPGPDVSLTNDTGGRLTKVVSYTSGSIARIGHRAYKATAGTSSTPATRPPSGPWEVYRLRRTDPGVTNPQKITVEGWGEAFILWGDDIQTWPGELSFMASHPPFRWQAGVIFKDFLCGRERTSLPNAQLLAGRAPLQTVITGPAAALDADGQANVMCCLAELLTHPVTGLGLPVSRLDAPTWQAVANYLYANAADTYISPVLDRADSVRSVAATLLAYVDAWLRYDPDALIEAGRWMHGEAPPVFTAAQTIDYHDLINGEDVEWSTTGWRETANVLAVKYRDGDAAFKERPATVASLFNRQITRRTLRRNLDRPWVTRAAQAARLAAVAAHEQALPVLNGPALVVRAEKAAAIRPGDQFAVAHYQAGLQAIARCTERVIEAPPSGRISLTYQAERGLVPQPYAPPAVTPPVGTTPSPGRITEFCLFPAPPSLGDGIDFRVACLAARSNSVTSEFSVWFQKDDAAAFQELGPSAAFAVAGRVDAVYLVPSQKLVGSRARSANVATIATLTAHGYQTGQHVSIQDVGGSGYDTIDVAITVTGSTTFTYPSTGPNEGTTSTSGGTVVPGLMDDRGIDIEVTSTTPAPDLERVMVTQTADAVRDGALLLFVFDQADPARFEVFSVKEPLALGGGVYRVSGLRAQFGTRQGGDDSSGWGVGDRAFLVYRADLLIVDHTRFRSLAESGLPATFRLVPSSAWQRGDVADKYDATNTGGLTTETTVDFDAPFAPEIAWEWITADGASITSWTTSFSDTTQFRAAVRFLDVDGDLAEAKLVARRGGAEVGLWSQAYPWIREASAQVEWRLPGSGTWQVVAVARDRAGRVTETPLETSGTPRLIQVETGSGGTKVATPTASPAGGSYYGSQTVTLACSTPGSTILYQVVGEFSDPAAWNPGTMTYSAPISVPPGKFLHVLATKSGLADSDLLTEHYRLRRL